MTLGDAPHELFESEATSLHFADLSLVYFVLGPTDSVHVISFYGLVSWIPNSSNIAYGPICFVITEWKQKASCPDSRHFSSPHVSVFFLGTTDLFDSIFPYGTSSLYPVFTHCQFSAKVLHWLHLFYCTGPRTHQIPQVHSGATEQICSRGSCSEILEPL